VQQSVSTATVRVKTRADNIAGVRLPVFEQHHESVTEGDFTGISKGGKAITGTRTAFATLLDGLIELASLQVRCGCTLHSAWL
jgi:V-type H+-transporting ATPase subunit D